MCLLYLFIIKENKPLFFKSQSELYKWLEKNHNKEKELFIGFYKKNSGRQAVTYQEALDAALCFGWIDGQANKNDEISWMQRFTPRRERSSWSKINTQNAERLIKSGRMKPAGLKQIEAAKQDGRWHRAYDSPSNAKLPEYFLKQVNKNPKTKKFLGTLNKVNLYSITYRLQTAKKPETKEKRMKAIIEMLEKGEKFH